MSRVAHRYLLGAGLSAVAILAAIPLAPIAHGQRVGRPDIREVRERPPEDPRSQLVADAYAAGAALNPAAAAFTDRGLWERTALGSVLERDALAQAWLEIAVTGVTYVHTLKRSPTDAELQQAIGKLKAGTRWEELWRELATSPERDQRFGHFAPAPMPPHDAHSFYQLPSQRHGEQCFGAFGSRCDGGVPGIYWSVQPQWKNFFSMPDGTQMGYVEIGVSVGSILHDNACVDAPEGTGVACNGYMFGEDWSKTSGQPASMEWNKAAWNVMDGRTWRAVYGPYPVDAALRHASWYDDLRPVPTRATKMALVLGPTALPVHSETYRGLERKMSAVLSAPRETAMDVPDPEFCQSRAFSLIVPVSAIPPKLQGVCQ